MNFPTIKDARGNRSTTLVMVAVALGVLLVKFAIGGLTTPIGGLPVITATEFGIAATGIIGVWTYRDSKQKKIEQRGGVPGAQDAAPHAGAVPRAQ